MSFWPFLAGTAIGWIIAAFMFSWAASETTSDHIAAGYFEHDGAAYRVTAVTP